MRWARRSVGLALLAGWAGLVSPAASLGQQVGPGIHGSSGGSQSWQLQSGGVRGWRAVACPSSGLCVVSKILVGIGSQVYASTNPTGGQTAWRLIGEDPGGVVVAFSCRPDTASCVAVDAQGGILNVHSPRHS